MFGLLQGFENVGGFRVLKNAITSSSFRLSLMLVFFEFGIYKKNNKKHPVCHAAGRNIVGWFCWI